MLSRLIIILLPRACEVDAFMAGSLPLFTSLWNGSIWGAGLTSPCSSAGGGNLLQTLLVPLSQLISDPVRFPGLMWQNTSNQVAQTNRDTLNHSSGGHKFKIKVLAGPPSSETDVAGSFLISSSCWRPRSSLVGGCVTFLSIWLSHDPLLSVFLLLLRTSFILDEEQPYPRVTLS